MRSEIIFSSNLRLKPKDYPVLSSSMVHFYPDTYSMMTNSLQNEMKVLSTCNIAGEIFYSLNVKFPL